MESLFRFNIVREANRAEDEISSIPLAADTAFQNSARAIPNGANRKRQLKALAANYIQSSLFVGSVAQRAPLAALDTAATSMDALIAIA